MAIGALGTAAIGLGSSILNSAFGWLTGSNSAKKQFEYQRQLNQEAFQHDVDMWNRQNEYNTPSAQMERLQAAGLNPNLVYGNGGATNTASGAPSMNAGHAPDVANARQAAASMANQGFQTALNLQLQQAQTRNIDADTTLKNQTSELTGVERQIKLFDKELKAKTLPHEMQYKVEKWKQDLLLGRNQIKIGEQQITLNQKEMEKLDAETGYIMANTKLSKAQAEQVSINLLYLPQMLESQIKANNANAYNAIQSGNLSVAKAETERTQQAINRIVKELKMTQRDIANATYNDVVANVHFKSLSAQEQYEILYDFGYAKAYKAVFGSEGELGSIYNPIMMNMNSEFGGAIYNPRHSRYIQPKKRSTPKSINVPTYKDNGFSSIR